MKFYHVKSIVKKKKKETIKKLRKHGKLINQVPENLKSRMIYEIHLLINVPCDKLFRYIQIKQILRDSILRPLFHQILNPKRDNDGNNDRNGFKIYLDELKIRNFSIYLSLLEQKLL